VGKAGVRHRRHADCPKTEECCMVTTSCIINQYTNCICTFAVLYQADIWCARTTAGMINPHIGIRIHRLSFNSNYCQNDSWYALSSLSFFKITSFRAPILPQKNAGSVTENKRNIQTANCVNLLAPDFFF